MAVTIMEEVHELVDQEIKSVRAEVNAVGVELSLIKAEITAINQRFDDLLDRLALEKRIEALERSSEEKSRK